MTPDTSTFVQSHDDVLNLADGEVLLQAKYSYSTTINGPFGTVLFTLVESSSGQHAFGTVVIQTIFAAGSETTLQYEGPATFNGSTGYTSIVAEGKGVISGLRTPLKPVKAKISIDLAPGFKTGTLGVEGYFDGMPITATSLTTGA